MRMRAASGRDAGGRAHDGDSGVGLGLQHLAAAVEAGRADVVAQVRFAGGRLDARCPAWRARCASGACRAWKATSCSAERPWGSPVQTARGGADARAPRCGWGSRARRPEASPQEKPRDYSNGRPALDGLLVGSRPRLSAASAANGLAPRAAGSPLVAAAAAAGGQRSWRGTSGRPAAARPRPAAAGRTTGSSASTSSSLSASSAAASPSPATKRKRAIDSSGAAIGCRQRWHVEPRLRRHLQLQPGLRRRAARARCSPRADQRTGGSGMSPAATACRASVERAGVDRRRAASVGGQRRDVGSAANARDVEPARVEGATRAIGSDSERRARTSVRRARWDNLRMARTPLDPRLDLALPARAAGAPAPAVRRRWRRMSTRRPRPAKRRPALAQRLALAKAQAVAALRPRRGRDRLGPGRRPRRPAARQARRPRPRRRSSCARCAGATCVFHTARRGGVRGDRLRAAGGWRRCAVRFRDLGDAEIEHYLRAEQPYDCAGSAKCRDARASRCSRRSTPTTRPRWSACR